MASTKTPSPSDEPQTKTYKEQLDEAATKANNPDGDKNQGGIMNTLVEKVSQYVPAAVGEALGQGHKDDKPTQTEAQTPALPERPHHDLQIEEFVRDQHRSRIADDSEATKQ